MSDSFQLFLMSSIKRFSYSSLSSERLGIVTRILTNRNNNLELFKDC